MDHVDKLAFAKLLVNTASGYGKKLSETTISEYWRTLESYPFTAVESAVERYKRYGSPHFMPTAPALLQMIESNLEARALSAWCKTVEAMQLVGCYQSIVFDDPAIHVVIDQLGGWIKLCLLEKSQLQFEKHNFIKLYIALLQQGAFYHRSKLIGIYEHQNNISHQPAAPPTLWGDKKLALITYSTGSTLSSLPQLLSEKPGSTQPHLIFSIHSEGTPDEFKK